MKLVAHTFEKPGRNATCPCGSGKKYKHCCANNESLQVSSDKSIQDQAQDLVYEAFNEDSAKKQLLLIEEALAIDPDCVDALTFLAQTTAVGPHEELLFLEKAVAAGVKNLGKEFIKENSGELWYMHEARPFLRAKFELAQTLWELRRQPEALKICWELLALNKNDNQGVRYVLFDYLILQNEREEIERLLSLFPEDGSTHWAFNKALYLFLKNGPDSREARKQLLAAHEENKFVVSYLAGLGELPEEIPGSYVMGGEDEAICYAADSGLGWVNNIKSLAWLVDTLDLEKEFEKKFSPKKSKSKRKH